jgi:cystathionine gamma-synthase
MGGAIPSPMDCYYLVRSIKTLPYRIKAMLIMRSLLAAFLEQHPK